MSSWGHTGTTEGSFLPLPPKKKYQIVHQYRHLCSISKGSTIFWFLGSGILCTLAGRCRLLKSWVLSSTLGSCAEHVQSLGPPQPLGLRSPDGFRTPTVAYRFVGLETLRMEVCVSSCRREGVQPTISPPRRSPRPPARGKRRKTARTARSR
ncbi:hypothetical protein B0F90DRAFT_824893 [Multifurca ochricompacta]|uniref:Uncharacterized protein n=1 Tax=Multifurca ochricompacta TaxID=376703 RepID=A0AAD4QKX7_9AGAM|nr:hypothetical protein B0F90DRAFT_824893 [Multifurca ochricompacta]